MLTLEQIKKNIGEDAFNRSPRSALIEYLQYEILDSIFKQKNSEKLSFIGGTAIRIVYGSGRFSEDLDFDNFNLDYKDFQTLLDQVVLDMRNKGFELEFRFVEKMAFHCYINFPKILFQNKLSPNEDEKILIRIDTVNKEKNISPEVFVLNGFDVYQKIIVNPVSVILAQKIIAILERKREKGRDFYDVSYLLSLTDPDYQYIKDNRGWNKEELRKKLLARAQEVNLEDLAEDVVPFLIKDKSVDRVISFKQYIEQKL